MTAYYNENDTKAAAWLRELIKADLIAPGIVDEKSIVDVNPYELTQYTQHHFFAGIGGWSFALRLAGWPDSKPAVTGSCPCQPFSDGNVFAQGMLDERHLWPVFRDVLTHIKPSVVFGEQVESAIRVGWLDQVFGDLEGQGYTCGAAILPASAIGADHERKRLFWVAHTGSQRRQRLEPLERIPFSAQPASAVPSDSFTRTRSALDGDYRDLLHCDGLSVVMERHAIKGVGNSIVPQVAAEFIKAYCEI